MGQTCVWAVLSDPDEEGSGGPGMGEEGAGGGWMQGVEQAEGAEGEAEGAEGERDWRTGGTRETGEAGGVDIARLLKKPTGLETPDSLFLSPIIHLGFVFCLVFFIYLCIQINDLLICSFFFVEFSGESPFLFQPSPLPPKKKIHSMVLIDLRGVFF